MAKKDLTISEKHLLDRKILVDDIIENLMLQAQGFNPRLQFRLHDASEQSQIKLLDHLVVLGVIGKYKEPNYSNITDNFISRNANKYTTRQISISIDPEKLNEYLAQFAKSEFGRAITSKMIHIDKGGFLHIPRLGYRLVPFASTKDPRHILEIILDTKDTRGRVWKASELEPYLDSISKVKKPEELLVNTVNNINRKVYKELRFKSFLVARRVDGKVMVQLNEQLV
jgi:hypothetical protein